MKTKFVKLLSCRVMLGCLLMLGWQGTLAHADSPVMITARASVNNYVSGQRGSAAAKQAATAARNEVGGRVISVKPQKKGQGHRVRMLVEGGRVVTVDVDGKGRVRAGD